MQNPYNTMLPQDTDQLIPHRQGRNKTVLELTEDMTVEKFMDYLYRVLREGSA